MNKFVECWHCEHYVWFSLSNDNSFAICDVKNSCVFANNKVCEQFLLGKGVHTNRDIPDYCIHYKRIKLS